MNFPNFHDTILYIQRTISFLGTMIILSGIIWALILYIMRGLGRVTQHRHDYINLIRMDLGRTLILGLEFIVAADLISTTITPDYYSLGIVGGIVIIRTILNFSLNRELASLRKEMH